MYQSRSWSGFYLGAHLGGHSLDQTGIMSGTPSPGFGAPAILGFGIPGAVGVSLAATFGFFAICLGIVWWIFRTGYRLKQ